MPLPTFHNVLFPEDVSYGSTGGPGFNTSVIELAGGAEQRNINWKRARATYDVKHGVKTREQMEHLLDFFTARRGKAYGFRFKDWMDYTLDRQVILPLNSVYQAYKRYEPETDFYFDRNLTKLVPDTIQLWVNGAVADPTLVNPDTGIISATGTVELACEFHVPVRFDTDEMKISHDDWEQMSWPSIPLVELKDRV